MSIKTHLKTWISFGVKIGLQASLIAVCTFSSSLFAESLSSAQSQYSFAPVQKNLFTKFDFFMTNRIWLAPLNENNYLSNEMSLDYNINSNWTIGVLGEYDQFTSAKSAVKSDFTDTDLRLTYTYAPTKKPTMNWDIGSRLLLSLPTSRSSQEQGEYAGGGVKLFGDLMTKSFTFSVSSRYYEFFYQESYISPTSDGPTKSQPDNQTSADIPPTFNTHPLTPEAPKLVANCNSYSDSSFVIVYGVTTNFMLRNEVRYESYGYFDDHYSSLFHDKYGAGYKFAREFALWASQDAVKNTDLPGAIFDSKYTTTIVSLYWSI